MLRLSPSTRYWSTRSPNTSMTIEMSISHSALFLRVVLTGWIAASQGEEGNPKMRLRVIRVLFAIYRFYTDSWMDLDEDIPGLLIGNTTFQERQAIAGWLRDALSQTKAGGDAGYSRQRYGAFLVALEQVDRP